MIFSIQHYLEDLFERRGLSDIDQYAVKLANLYGKFRHEVKRADFLRSMKRLRTVFFRNNPELDRSEYEESLLDLLDVRFSSKKKSNTRPDPLPDLVRLFPGGVSNERARLHRRTRRTIHAIVSEFCRATEARAIDVFWQSRRRGKLNGRPEKIGQGLLAVFVSGVLSRSTDGFVLREMLSGIGYVDVAVILSKTLHLVELKIIRSTFTGATQLQEYMRKEGRKEGWLIVFDARQASRRPPIARSTETGDGVVRIFVVDINPAPPSSRSR